MKTFDELVEGLNEAGWLVRDCYQTAPGKWTVTLHRPFNISTAYGQGSSPTQALKKAMDFWQPKTKRVRLKR